MKVKDFILIYTAINKGEVPTESCINELIRYKLLESEGSFNYYHSDEYIDERCHILSTSYHEYRHLIPTRIYDAIVYSKSCVRSTHIGDDDIPIITLKDLIMIPQYKLLRCRNIGKGSVSELNDNLINYLNLKCGMTIDEINTWIKTGKL